MSTTVEGPYGSVEVRRGGGRGALTISGVPGPVGREIATRVRSAIEAAGFEFPMGGIAVYAGPAVPAGSKLLEGLDLAVAVGILRYSLQIKGPMTVHAFCAGLSLGGELRPVRESFARLERARDAGRILVGAAGSTPVFSLVKDGRFVALRTLREVVDHLTTAWVMTPESPNPYSVGVSPTPWPVSGRVPAGAQPPVGLVQVPLGSVVVVLASGEGAPLAVAESLRESLGPLSAGDLPDVLRAADVAGLEPVARRPFRAPHHTVSVEALEAEWLLAVHGVLYLDHAECFRARTLRKLAELRAQMCVVVLSIPPDRLGALTKILGPTIVVRVSA